MQHYSASPTDLSMSETRLSSNLSWNFLECADCFKALLASRSHYCSANKYLNIWICYRMPCRCVQPLLNYLQPSISQIKRFGLLRNEPVALLNQGSSSLTIHPQPLLVSWLCKRGDRTLQQTHQMSMAPPICFYAAATRQIGPQVSMIMQQGIYRSSSSHDYATRSQIHIYAARSRSVLQTLQDKSLIHQPAEEIQVEALMETGPPICPTRVDISPPKPNQQWEGFAKTLKPQIKEPPNQKANKITNP